MSVFVRPHLVVGLALPLVLGACKGPPPSAPDGGSGTQGTVPALLFGVNVPWSDDGDGIMRYGDQLLDRSFQEGLPGAWKLFVPTGGVATVKATGGDPAPPYATPPFLELTDAAATPTCAYQPLLAGRPDTSYTVSVSLEGVAGSPAVQVGLWDTITSPTVLASAAPAVTAGTWTRQTVTLTPTPGARPGLFFVCNLAARSTLGVDEVRLVENGSSMPRVLPSAVAAMKGLDVRALRWPGGTLSDTMHWKRSVGPTLERGELQSLAHFETPALGLNEFLDLCEQLGATPLVQVDVLDPPQDAADLVEYVLGDRTTPQGAKRAANGRSAPWNVHDFEIGNEPAKSYVDGAHYAKLAGAIAKAMQAKAAALGVQIRLAGVTETSFQLADWLPSVPLLADWNAEAFAPGAGLTGNVQMAGGHFYSYFATDPTEAARFEHAMSAGTLLAETRSRAIGPATGGLPLWITEYGTVLQDPSGTIQTRYLVDRQSGLVLGDELLTMIRDRFPAAFAYDLAGAEGFGLLRDPGTWTLRPAGVVFQLLSPLAGGTLLSGASFGASPGGTVTVSPGVGNIPTGLAYPVVMGVAVENAATGGLQVVVINRDDAKPQQVTVRVPGFTGGWGTIYRYEGALSDDNESVPGTVAATAQANRPLADPMVLTLKPHSLVRIDVQ